MNNKPIALLSYLLICSLLLLADSSVLATQSVDRSTTSKCELRIAYSEWPPYHYTSEGGMPTGLQVTLLKEIAKEADCTLNFVSMIFSDSIVAVKDGRVDVTMNATNTAERRKFGNFSEPFRNETLVLYVNERFANECSNLTLEELLNKGFVLGLQKDLIYGDMVAKIQNNPELNKKIRYFKDIYEDFKFLQDNNLDGTISDPLVVRYLWRSKKLKRKMSSCHIAVNSSPVSLLFSKKTTSEETLNKFNRAIKKVKSSEKYRKQWVW